MPLFLSEEEFRQCSGDGVLVAEKADAFIRELYRQIETVKAEADAAYITSEQTCSLIEQKYVSLSAELSSLQSQHSELNSSLEGRVSELAQLQSEKQQLLLQSIEKDGEIERLTREASELHKSKRQLMEMLDQKDSEVSEKNATIKSYLDKIVNLTENAALKEARLGDLESEMGQLHARCARLSQEKELLERHNTWLDDELSAKVDSLIQLRKTNGEQEADMSSKLADVERKFEECARSLKLHKDRLRELEEKLVSTEGELLSTKDEAAAAEERFSAEISTVTKLVDLYKESSDEWSKKAGELEGVIKALETHLNQVENEYKERLENEVSTRKEVEKESADLREKLQARETDLEKLTKENELRHLPLSSFTTDSWVNSADTGEMVVDDRAIVPWIPSGVSGTALAASLLRDGWTLAKMYAKYQEAVDALRHEQLGRKQTQAILERVLYEVEEKAGAIMDEREEHGRLVEVYSALDQKLQHSLSERSVSETTIQELKAILKRQERDYAAAQQEIVDLQKQVAVLLKECRDVQLRCGFAACHNDDELISTPAFLLNSESSAENIISERLLTFKDINGLVEQNVQLRSLVRNLSEHIEEKEAELKYKYEKELQMQTDETASKVNAVLLRAEEQGRMIESLHTSVAMYKKLYEEEHKLHSLDPRVQEGVPEQGSREVVLFHGFSHDTSTKVQEQAYERVKNLEEDLAKSRNDIISLRAERDKLALEAQFAQEKLARFMKEFEHQREEHNRVLSRNVEFSQFIVEYQRQLRESSESVNAANDNSRKLTMEVSVLKHEKEILQNAEKRASDEVRSLSERVHRLQATLDTIQSTEEVREEARGIERRKQEEYINKIEREWAEAKRAFQEERDNVRNLTLERESTLNNALRQVEDLSKGLANALQSVAAAESRAAVAEARYFDLEKLMESARAKDSDGGPSSSTSEKILVNFREEIEKLREELQASNDHMQQYKSIAEVSEEALKQMESVHENFRNEADEVKRSLETELLSLRKRVNELESECTLKTEEAISTTAAKEEAVSGALSEIASLKNDCAAKMSQISALKDDLEKEHQRWRAAQDNYERQVILQSETIQELTKTSQGLASAQEETSELRKVVDVLKTENSELKSKWEAEKLAIEVYRTDADKKYYEINELNKILHSQLEALHIKLAEKERGLASGGGSQTLSDDDGMRNVVNYLRRSKEIAETEISLLKQEKHSLQTRLDSALKSAEAAQASLHSERVKSRTSVFSEEEFKSIQLQVRELNLLRESNMQLREENRHNFEECQKLREALQSLKVEYENLEKVLRDRDTDLEASKKEIEAFKMEKANLEKRIEELVEQCKNVDIEDYNRLKESFQQMQVSLKEKDTQLDEIKKLLSEKQNAISLLERDLAKSRAELNERENKINERDNRVKELEQAESSLKSDFDKVRRLSVQVRRKSEGLLKEKEELSKEIQSLSQQLEEAKQAKRNAVDPASEQALKEKEKEKDTRIQILERTLERNRDDLKSLRDELKKEREENNKVKENIKNDRKTILGHRQNVVHQQTKLSGELKKHKQALKALQDEVEKLKNPGESNQSQSIANNLLEDFASAYFQAVENFEQVSQPAFGEVDAATSSDAPKSLDNAPPVGVPVGQTSAGPTTNVPLTRSNEEKDRKIALQRANIKTGRRLVRPSITKPKEPQAADVDMSEADESQNIESQGNPTIPTPSLIRKRSLSPFASNTREETPNPEEPSPDAPTHPLKKSKPSEVSEEQLENLPEGVSGEEPSDDVEKDNLQQDKDETDDADKDESETEMEEPAVNEQVQIEPASEIPDEKLDKPSETVQSDDESGGEREEGEVDGDIADNDVDNEMGGPGEFQTDQSVEPENSPSNEPTLEAGEIETTTPPEEEKNGSEITDGLDPISETEKTSTTEEAASTSTTTCVEVAGSEKPVSPLNSSTTTTINLQERARLRSQQRYAGMVAPPSNRGRGRVIRGRGARGGRTPPRGQSPG